MEGDEHDDMLLESVMLAVWLRWAERDDEVGRRVREAMRRDLRPGMRHRPCGPHRLAGRESDPQGRG